ncbi:MAG: glycosyltransferase [Kiritimatiellae bacterium]|nr:glycosyltransferase [Kiritimatiellia bacterium]
MKPAAPVLTVIVPAFNMESYLSACLGSLGLQASSMDSLDVIVVNDGSQDRTGEIAHAFAQRSPGAVRIIDKQNGNYGSCINAALSVARGEYVKVLDADDAFDGDALAEFVEFLAGLAEPRPDMVFSDYSVVDASGRVAGTEKIPFAPGRAIDLAEILAAPPVMMHGVAYRTQMLRDLGYRQLEGVSYTDLEWSFLPLAGVRSAVRFPRVLYRYLLGRERQTMSGEALARSWWMRGEVALHMAGRFYEIAAHVQNARSAALERRLAELVADVYRGCIFGDRRRARGFDIAAFDARLAKTSPSCHAAVAEVPYSRRIPYRFVKAWRARAWWRGVANALCRIYTCLCACLARLNMGKWIH